MDKARIITLARNLIADNALILDTETTGLDDRDEIVEIALIDAADTLAFSCLVKPSRPIPENATAIHGITDAMVEYAMVWPGLFFSLEWLTAKRTVLAYNSAFDSRMVKQSDAIYAYERPEWRWGCLMQMWQDYHELPRWQRLENVCYSIGIAPGGHRAMGDAKAAREVLRWLARQEG